MDDIVIYSRPFEEHLDHIWTAPGLLSISSVLLKLEKCLLFEDHIFRLGHVVPPGRIVISTKASDTIGGLKHPTNRA